MLSRRVRKVLGRGALGCGATLVGLVLAEVVYRLAFAADNGPTTNPRYVDHDDQRGWSYRPNVALRHTTAEFDVAIRTDADGWRVGATAPRRVRGPDIVCVGDSFTFGWGVEAEQCFAALLRTRLGANVRNLGVSGYGPGQELITLRAAGLDPRPALAIVTYCGNDLAEVLADNAYGKGKPRFVLDGEDLRRTNTPVPCSFLERHSQLFVAVRKLLGGCGDGALTAAQTGTAQRLTLRLHREMCEAVRAVGGQLLVVAVGEPWLRRDVPGMGFLDVGPALERARAAAPVEFAQDGHWNVHGHRAVAEAIAQHVIAHGMLH